MHRDSGRDPFGFLGDNLSVPDRQDIAAFVHKALLWPQRRSRIERQISDKRLRMIERVKGVVAYEKTPNVLDGVFYSQTGKKRLRLTSRCAEFDTTSLRPG